MRGPKPQASELTELERCGLEALARRHTTPQQMALRARSILAAADGRNNVQSARDLAVGVAGGTLVARAVARLWRGRWRDRQAVALADLSVAQRLAEAPRSGAPARLSAAQVCQLVALACAAPATTGRPISQWTDREIADEGITRGIAETISPRHAGRLRKRGICSPSAFATGGPRRAMTRTSTPRWPTSARSTAPRRPWPSGESGWSAPTN